MAPTMLDDTPRSRADPEPPRVRAHHDVTRQRISVLLVAHDTPPLAAALAERGLRPDVTHTINYTPAPDPSSSTRLTGDPAPGYDAVVFLPDRSDPVPDAVSILRRENPDAVLIVIADTDDETVLQALDAGADDHWVPGSHPTAVAARIRAHVRRSRREAQVRLTAEQASTDVQTGHTPPDTDRRSPPADPSRLHVIGALTLDARARTCTVQGHPLALRRTQFDLLAALAATPGEHLTVQQLVSAAWPADAHVRRKTLAVHLSAIRGRLTDAYEEHRVPQTRRATVVSRRRRGYALAVVTRGQRGGTTEAGHNDVAEAQCRIGTRANSVV